MRRQPANASPREKVMARELAAISGAPYLHAIYTDRTLSRLAGRVDLGELEQILQASPDQRLLGLPVDELDLKQLDHFLDTGGFHLGDEAVVTPGASNEIRLLIPFQHHEERFTYEHILGGPLWPSGAWTLPTAGLHDQIRDEQLETAPSLVVRARRTPNVVDPPAFQDDDAETEPLASLFDLEPRLPRQPRGRQAPSHPDDTRSPLVPEPLVECARQLLRDHDVQTEAGAQVAIYRCRTRSGEWCALDLPTEQTLWLVRQKAPPT